MLPPSRCSICNSTRHSRAAWWCLRMENARNAIVFTAFSRRRFCEEDTCLQVSGRMYVLARRHWRRVFRRPPLVFCCPAGIGHPHEMLLRPRGDRFARKLAGAVLSVVLCLQSWCHRLRVTLIVGDGCAASPDCSVRSLLRRCPRPSRSSSRAWRTVFATGSMRQIRQGKARRTFITGGACYEGRVSAAWSTFSASSPTGTGPREDFMCGC